MPLLGGILRDGVRSCDFSFKPVTGALELEVAQLAVEDANPPERVTAVLDAALESLGGEPSTPERVRQLCVGDRQHLVRQLGVHLGQIGSWRTAECLDCDERFDLFVDLNTLPASQPQPGFPFVDVETGRGKRRFRVPNGGDQEAIAGVESLAEDEAVRALVRLCVIGEEIDDEFDTADLEAIDRALEDASPEVAQEIVAKCPACGRTNALQVDPYSFLTTGPASLFSAVHTLASAYGWSEAEILALPRERRDLYLELASNAGGTP